MRSRDDQLYLAGLYGRAGNKKRRGGFYRVCFTGKPLHLVEELQVASDGLLATFTSPLDPKTTLELTNYQASHWSYRWTERYGSDQYRHNGEKGHDIVSIRKVALSEALRTVFLGIPQIAPVMQMRLRTADGTLLKPNIYHTIHALGSRSALEEQAGKKR